MGATDRQGRGAPRRLFALLMLVVVTTACSSHHARTAASASSGTSSGFSSGVPGTLDASALSDIDREGATALLKLFADDLHKLDASITRDQVDCVPSAVLSRIPPQQLFAIVDRGLGNLTPDDAAKIESALRDCHFTDDQIARARLS